MVGFGGISYTANVFDDKITSTDNMLESGYNKSNLSYYNDHPMFSGTLEQELLAAGLDPYDRNVYGRSDELIRKVRSIRKLAYAITSRKGSFDVVDVMHLNSAGLTDQTPILYQLSLHHIIIEIYLAMLIH